MKLRDSLTGQYRAGLHMLRSCLEVCPPEVWTRGEHPRTTWRIAYHALFYTHFYLMPSHEEFQPWERHAWHAPILWIDDESGVPPDEHPYSIADMTEYLDFIDENLAGWLAALDLESDRSGFPWYPMSKLEHLLASLRHLSVHVGQLQEILYAEGVEPQWTGKG